MRILHRLLFGASAWTVAIPVVACIMLAAVWGRSLGWILLPCVVAVLVAAVLTAVHHAEVIALRVGEPFGTLVLALAVTAIEVSLIVALMLSGGDAASALARDTVFATVMIICNGVVGLCLLMGALRHRVLAFRVEGTTPVLSVLATLATLTLVLPTFTSSTPGPTLSPSQLVFAGIVSLALYAVFVFVQTVRHREYFLPVEVGAEVEIETPNAVLPSGPAALSSLALLFLSLIAVVGLAKTLAPSIEVAVRRHQCPMQWSALPSRSWFCFQRPGPPCAQPFATACKPASILRWARLSPPSASPSPLWS